MLRSHEPSDISHKSMPVERLLVGLLVLMGVQATGPLAHSVEARGFPGCSPGRVCITDASFTSAFLLEGSLQMMTFIATDALEWHDTTQRALSFYPNCTEEGPTASPQQTLEWREMTAFHIGFPRARISLNPDEVSSTTLRSLEEDGFPFFPAEHTVNLFLVWDFLDSDLTVFNKEPLRLISTTPVAGFPPFQGPDYTLSEAVELFSAADPGGPPLMTLEGSVISGSVKNLFSVDIDRQEDSFAVSVATLQEGIEIPVKIFAAMTPGFGNTPRTEIDATVGYDPFEFTVPSPLPAEPCFDYFEVWVVSMDPSRLGMTTEMVEIEDGPGCTPPDPFAEAGPDRTVPVGTDVSLSGSGSSSNGVVKFCWVPPNGITLDDPTSANPTFVAPPFAEDRDLLFTLYVHDGEVISPPDSTKITVRAQAGALPIPTVSTVGLVVLMLLLSILGAILASRYPRPPRLADRN